MVQEPTLKIYGNVQKKNTRGHTSGKGNIEICSIFLPNQSNIHLRSPGRHRLKGWGHPRVMNNMGQSHPLAHVRTHTHITSLHSQIRAAVLFLGSISRIRPKIGAEGLGVQLPPLSHTPSLPTRLVEDITNIRGVPGGGGVDGTSHTTRYCRLILIFTILRFLPPGAHKHTEIKYGPSLCCFVYWRVFCLKLTCLSSLLISSSFTFDLSGKPIDRVLSKLNSNSLSTETKCGIERSGFEPVTFRTTQTRRRHSNRVSQEPLKKLFS